MESSSKSNDINSSDLNIEYSSDSDKLSNKQDTSNQSIHFDNSDRDSLSDNDSSLIINLFESEISKSEPNFNNSDSLEITYEEKLYNSNNEMSTNTDDFNFEKSSISSELKNSIVDNIVNVDLITSTINDNEVLSSSIQSSETSFNENIIIENSDSSKDLIDKSLNSIDIKEIIDENNKKSIGTNTDELILTLKIPFDKGNIINASQINLNNNIPRIDQEEKKKLELEELKKNLIKKNEMKMQKMFDILLEKQNNEIEDEIENLGGPKKIKKKTEVPEENFKNMDDNIANETKDKSDSDPFNMDYKLNKKNNKSNFYEDDVDKKRKDFLNKRKEEIKKLANDFKKQEINDSIGSEDNISGSSLSSKSNSNSEKIEKDKEKDENFLKRKSERREKFLERRGLKKNILNKVFDMIYIINLEKDRKKVQPLLKKFDSHNVKYQISDGVDAKTSNYIKYFNRWLYQKDNTKYKLTKLLFDFEIYKRKNPDLEDKGITNKIRAWNHWSKNGHKEGRKLYEKTNIQNVSQLGCVLAHNRAILDAIKNGYSNILILEDDIYLDDNFFEKIEEIFNNIPKWDILYFGASQKKWDGINLDSKNVYYNANSTLGTFAYGLNKSLFRPLTEYSMELIDSIDKCLQIFHHFNSCFVLYPNIIITNIENSKIHRSRDIQIYSKIYKWNIDNFDLEFYDYIENE